MTEILLGVIPQILILAVGVLTVVVSFMKSNTVRDEWKERNKSFTASDKEIRKKSTEQDSKITNLSDRLDAHERSVPVLFDNQNRENDKKFPSRLYVDGKFDSVAVLASSRYDSIKEDQREMRETLKVIEQLFTEARTQEIKDLKRAKEDLEKELKKRK